MNVGDQSGIQLFTTLQLVKQISESFYINKLKPSNMFVNNNTTDNNFTPNKGSSVANR